MTTRRDPPWVRLISSQIAAQVRDGTCDDPQRSALGQTHIESDSSSNRWGTGRVTTRRDPPWARLISSQIAAQVRDGDV